MKKEDKIAAIEKITETVNKYAHFYLIDFSTMDAASTSSLRRKCFESEIKLMVVKNSLLHKVLDKKEGDFSPLDAALKGSTAIMLSDTGNKPAKLLKEVAKNGVPALKGAYVEESFYIGADQLDALCNIKSKDELVADLIALLQSPAKNLVSALQSSGNSIHGILETIGEKNK